MAENAETILLSKREIEGLLTIGEVIEVVEKTYNDLGEGRAINPAKLCLDLGESGNWPNYNAFVDAMPAYVGWLDMAGLKWVGGFWSNVERGLPSISAMILLIDPRTGVFKAVMEGAYITALRTGAATAVGAKYLARKDSKVVGIYGAGTQGRFQALALSKVVKMEQLKIYDIRKDAMGKYVEEIGGKISAKVIPVETPEEAADADIVITATSSKTPFLKCEWIKEGTLVVAIGSSQELYDDAIKRADKIIVDHIEQGLHRATLKALVEKGELNGSDIYATIGEIVANKKIGRVSDKEIILYVPTGIGALDVAVATIAYEKALRKGVGQKFKFV